MARVFVCAHSERYLLDYFDTHQYLLNLHGYKVLYSGEHVNIKEDNLCLYKHDVQVAVIRPESPHTIICNLRECELVKKETILAELTAILVFFESETPVLIEVD